MTADKPKPPTEAELAAIKARADKATPGPWSHGLDLIPPDDAIELANGGTVAHIQRHGNVNTVRRLGEEFSHDDARFIAHARQDVPALLAAVEERDHLLWVMSQDQEAYHRGVEDRARNQWAKDLALMGSPGTAAPGELQLLKSLSEWNGQEPPPLPPDRIRAENERLRSVLRAIALLEADDDSPVGVGMTLVSAQRTAREVLLGESS